MRPLAAWSGLAPGFAGLDQSNVKVPATAREGCAVPIQAAYYDNSPGISQPVTIAIRNGGGPCVDPPSAGYGQITWQKKLVLNLLILLVITLVLDLLFFRTWMSLVILLKSF